MYLSKLELHGFKSFAERTVLHFDPGITAIVGPNGCGKSNIVDAVRWVIGEQRARILRSDKMENVIFNGTSKRKPLGMSEVLLTIENNRGVLPTEYSEVELGRRLYRSGDSEYLMNGVQCRLKDITDLFMDTGMGAGAYSVIELKMVDEILSENAEDRRRLFEEAAGITRYKLRRRQTLNKLDGTQADLTRIRDLTEEIGKQVRSLQRQARKAERYKEVAAELHQLELALAAVEFIRLSQRRAELEQEIATLQNESTKASSAETREDASLARLREELRRREEELAVHRSKLEQHLDEVRTLETERRLAEERLEASRRELERTRQDQEAAFARSAALEAERVKLQAALEDAQPRLEEAARRLDDARAEHESRRAATEELHQALQNLIDEQRSLETRRTEQRRALDRALNRQELLDADIARTTSQIEHLQADVVELQDRASLTEKDREEANASLQAAQEALQAAMAERDALQTRIDQASERVRSTERRRDALNAEVQLLESMLSSYEDLSGAVQYLASSDWAADRFTTVADVLACDDAHRLALDAALGSYSGCIVVHTDADAHRAIAKLRADEQGRATFIVLSRVSGTAATRPSVGVKPLRELVRTTNPQYDPLADLLLQGAYLVDTLERAEALAVKAGGNARYFTPSGEWVDAHGMVHAGGRQDTPSAVGNRLGRREQLERTQVELATATDEAKRAIEEETRLRQNLLDVPIEQLESSLAEARRRVHDLEKLADRASYELEAAVNRASELEERRDQALRDRGNILDEVRRLEQAVEVATARLDSTSAQVEEARASFEVADNETRESAAALNEANIHALQARNEHENLSRDLDRTRREISELRDRTEERSRLMTELDATIEASRSRLEETRDAWKLLEGRRNELEEAVAYADEAVRQTREAISNVESELRGIRRSREQLLREENLRNVRLAEVQTRSADLVEHIQEEFSIDLPVAVEQQSIPIPDDFDERSARSRVGELRQSLRSLGGVNELALEAYEEEKERLDFLMQQQEDLERAERTLLETIREINTTASERFLETFELIRSNFQRIFTDLFGAEAAADLELEDPNDPLESAIEIKARPRGKRPSTISQLSGGEKTLTAIALLFGIYLVKPSPFCILDEVDAPLDDANVERFMRLIRQFAADTQFILVTHNKLTMQAADRLYGITMQEQGVSRLVGVRFDEAVRIVDRQASREAA